MQRILKWNFFVILAFAVTASFPAAAGPLPAVAKQIPGNAALVMVLEKPGATMIPLTSFLARFKMFSPELDLVSQGAKLKAELGENLLTAEGMRNFGLDPNGSFGAFSLDLDAAPVIALSLSSSSVFKQKLFAAIEKASGLKPGKARQVAGAEVLEGPGGAVFALKGSWCLLMDKSLGKEQDSLVKAFWGGGKKLQKLAGFQRAWGGASANTQAMLFLPMAGIVSKVQQETGESIRSLRQQLKSISPDRRAWMESELKLEQARQRSLVDMLKLLDAFAMSWGLSDKQIDWAARLLPSKQGRGTFAKLFPAGAKVPVFHADLAKGAILSAWSSFGLKTFLDMLGPLPTAPGRTMADETRKAAEEFKAVAGMDLVNDVIGNFEGSMAFYVLSPDTALLRAEMQPEMQVLTLLRVGLIVKAADPVKLTRFVQQMEASMAEKGGALESKQIGDLQLRTVRPAPGVVLSWTQKADALILAMGEGTLEGLVRVAGDKLWQPVAAAKKRGQVVLDFANLTETLSGAVSHNLGGEQGRDFRIMIWPMLQQILAQFGSLQVEAEMVGSDLLMSLGIRLR